MKTLLILTLSLLSFNSSYASCLEQVKKDAESKAFLFLQDSIDFINVTQVKEKTFNVYAQTELDPEYTYVEGTYQVEYSAECKEVSYKILKPMTEGSDYPEIDYSRTDKPSAPCDHCGDEYDK